MLVGYNDQRSEQPLNILKRVSITEFASVLRENALKSSTEDEQQYDRDGMSKAFEELVSTIDVDVSTLHQSMTLMDIC